MTLLIAGGLWLIALAIVWALVAGGSEEDEARYDAWCEQEVKRKRDAA